MNDINYSISFALPLFLLTARMCTLAASANAHDLVNMRLPEPVMSQEHFHFFIRDAVGLMNDSQPFLCALGTSRD